jgi:hypothetical protein
MIIPADKHMMFTVNSLKPQPLILLGMSPTYLEELVPLRNLLLFKTVIAGDSWGLIAVPVIEQLGDLLR